MDTAIIVVIISSAAGIITAITGAISNYQNRKYKKAEENFTDIKNSLNKLKDDVKAANDGLGEVKKSIDNIKALNLEKERAYLTETYHKTKQKGFCPAELKDVYRQRFMDYRDAGYNHVRQHWLEEILALPEHLEEE